MNKCQIVGVIPSYKPDEKLIHTVSATLRACKDVDKLIVVDDGSGIEFAAVFHQVEALDERVVVLYQGINSGMGGAIKAGLQYVFYHYPSVDGIIMFDADGQHHPEDIAKVVTHFQKDPDAFVIGTREYHDPAIVIPLRSRFGNCVSEIVFHLCIGVRLKDTQSGLRCYPRRIAALCSQIEKNRYEFQLAALILAVESARLVQVPIQTIYEENNRRSHFRPIIDSFRIYAVFLRFMIASLAGFAIDYIVFAAGYAISGCILGSLIASRVVSCSSTFLINKYSVFKSSKKALPEVFRFIIVASLLFTLSYIGMRMFKDILGTSPLVSKILVETFLFVGSFLVLRFCVFPGHRQGR